MPAPSIPNTLRPELRARMVYDTLAAIQRDAESVELARVRAGADPSDVMAAFADGPTPVTYAEQTDRLVSQQQALASRYSDIWADVQAIATAEAEAAQPED